MSDETLSPEDFAEAAGSAIADAATRPEAMAATLAEAGLFAVSVPEASGGMGLSAAFAVPVARAAGAQGLRFPLVEQMLLTRAFAGTPEGEALLAGTTTGTIAWTGDIASGEAGLAGWVTFAQRVLVADGAGAALLDLSKLTVTTDLSLDPEAPQGFVTPDTAAVVARIDAATFAGLKAEAELLYAALAVGAAEGALERTATHVSTRVQFGRLLSAKQAVRHHMAQMKLVTEAAAARLIRALGPDELGVERRAGSALTGAISSGTFVLEKAIQLHGGMGFTWEIPLHYQLRELRRVAAAMQVDARDVALGDAVIDAA